MLAVGTFQILQFWVECFMVQVVFTKIFLDGVCQTFRNIHIDFFIIQQFIGIVKFLINQQIIQFIIQSGELVLMILL